MKNNWFLFYLVLWDSLGILINATLLCYVPRIIVELIVKSLKFLSGISRCCISWCYYVYFEQNSYRMEKNNNFLDSPFVFKCPVLVVLMPTVIRILTHFAIFSLRWYSRGDRFCLYGRECISLAVRGGGGPLLSTMHLPLYFTVLTLRYIGPLLLSIQ